MFKLGVPIQVLQPLGTGSAGEAGLERFMLLTLALKIPDSLPWSSSEVGGDTTGTSFCSPRVGLQSKILPLPPGCGEGRPIPSDHPAPVWGLLDRGPGECGYTNVTGQQHL